jgi:hypothetical protein
MKIFQYKNDDILGSSCITDLKPTMLDKAFNALELYILNKICSST